MTSYTFGSYTVEVFTATGAFTFTPPSGITSYDVLLVGGGAGGGRGNLSTTLGGGGGAGGVKLFTGRSCTPGVGISGSVGGGGAGATTNNTDGSDGTGSSLGSDSVSGGGGGGAGASSSGGTNAPGRNGASGGGGGCSSNSTLSPFAGGTGISGEGHAGGQGIGNISPSDARNAGGGGGAGAVGTAGSLGNTTPFVTYMGHGGAGADYSADFGTTYGVSGWFGGGGGGGTSQNRGGVERVEGGQGGGGRGGERNTIAGEAGTANTGGGGGGSSSDFNGGAGADGIVLVRYAAASPPGIPTSVSANPDIDSIELTWSAPVTGGTVTSYEVRLDGGTPSTETSPYTFTGLTGGTSYDLEVRAVGPGGSSSWVLVTVETDPSGPEVAYEVSIRVGDHFWEIEVDDPADLEGPEVLAGATFTWSAPDDQGWPPLPWVMPLDTLSMRLYAPTAAEVADIARGDVVHFKFTPEGYDYTEPLLDFAGRLSSEPQITDHPGPRGGVFVDLVAVDYRVDLMNTTIWGSEASGTFAVIDITENPYDLLITDDELPTDIDTLLAANHPEWPAGGMGNILDGTSVDGTTFPDYAGATVLYGTTESASLWQIYRALGVFPWPNFDDDGDLIPGAPFRYIDVAFDGSDYETADPIDAALVPNPSWQWRRNYLPNIMETTGITGNPPRYQGGDHFEDPPADPHLIRRSFTDFFGVGGDFNLYGFANEIPTDSPWGLYVFTIRAWTEPLAVQRFFTYPHRVRRLISVDNIAADKDPTGTGAVEGMLRGAQLVIAPKGRWFVTAGMRIGKPGPPPEE